MLKINSGNIEVKTGVKADGEKELVVYFRQFSNVDNMNVQFGRPLTNIIFDMFLCFNYPVQAVVGGEVKEIKSLEQLSQLPACKEVMDILTPCMTEIAKAINKSGKEVEEVEKKSSSAGKSSEQASKK